MTKTCSIDGCGSVVGKNSARGWCFRHYQRWQRHGDPLGGAPERPVMTDEERFWSRVTKTESCWNWTGTKSDSGYGLISINGTVNRAHRLAWELLVGPIPEGIHIDHRCMNKSCVNPEHLRHATHKQNSEHLALRSTNKSGYRGVSFSTKRGAWRVQISHNYRTINGGFFSDVHEAGEAAKALRNELFTHNDLDRTEV